MKTPRVASPPQVPADKASRDNSDESSNVLGCSRLTLSPQDLFEDPDKMYAQRLKRVNSLATSRNKPSIIVQSARKEDTTESSLHRVSIIGPSASNLSPETLRSISFSPPSFFIKSDEVDFLPWTAASSVGSSAHTRSCNHSFYSSTRHIKQDGQDTLRHNDFLQELQALDRRKMRLRAAVLEEHSRIFGGLPSDVTVL
mmetsp:Transcript_19697/g.28939  ORF Transcript_19697/g.28939 Transcript_19697/m.28939 type:complete len:199 (+) Transcript_19697:125-721(+)